MITARNPSEVMRLILISRATWKWDWGGGGKLFKEARNEIIYGSCLFFISLQLMHSRGRKKTAW